MRQPADRPAEDRRSAQKTADETAVETPLRWDDGLLAYGGQTIAPIERTIDDLREERMRQIRSGHKSWQSVHRGSLARRREGAKEEEG